MFKAIVVATDLSDAWDQALKTAAQLAGEHGSALHVLHVLRDPRDEPWAIEALGVGFGGLLEELRSRAQENLAARVRDLGVSGGATARVLIGAPAPTIVQYAHRVSADLIVLGSHGRSPMQRVLLGSVADRVLQEARCPVLVVRRAAVPAQAVDDVA